jgi:hypothetical protein
VIDQNIVPKGKYSGRHSELSLQMESQQVMNKILDVPVMMLLQDLLGLSRELCSGLQDMIKIKNSKMTVSALGQKEPSVATSFISQNRGLLIHIKVECEGTPIDAIIDTGSELNVVKEEIVQQLIRKLIDISKGVCMNDANGGEGYLRGMMSDVMLTCGGVSTQTNLFVRENVNFDLLLGHPWQRGNFVSIDEWPSGTYLLFKDPEGLQTRFEFLVTPETRREEQFTRGSQINTLTYMVSKEQTDSPDSSTKSRLPENSYSTTNQIRHKKIAEHVLRSSLPIEIVESQRLRELELIKIANKTTQISKTLAGIVNVANWIMSLAILFRLSEQIIEEMAKSLDYEVKNSQHWWEAYKNDKFFAAASTNTPYLYQIFRSLKMSTHVPNHHFDSPTTLC